MQYKIHYSMTSKAENKISNVSMFFSNVVQGHANVADFQPNLKVQIDQQLYPIFFIRATHSGLSTNHLFGL